MFTEKEEEIYSIGARNKFFIAILNDINEICQNLGIDHEEIKEIILKEIIEFPIADDADQENQRKLYINAIYDQIINDLNLKEKDEKLML